MARPIKETPILKGDDAIRFLDHKIAVEKKGPDFTEKRKIEHSYQNFKKMHVFIANTHAKLLQV